VKISRRAAAGTATIILLCSAAFGQRGSAGESLKSLADQYRDCVSVEVRVHTDEVPGVSVRSASTHAVLSDGRLASSTWIGFTGPLASVWTTPPTEYRYRSEGEVIVPWSPQTYLRLGPEEIEGGALEHDRLAYLSAPWPRIAEWSADLEHAEDLVFSRSDGVYTAMSRTLGLSLRWEESGRLLAAASGNDAAWREFEFQGLSPGPFFPPSSALQRLRVGKVARPEVTLIYDRVAFNLADEEAAVSSGSVTGTLLRYEVETGDVFEPSGELSYNEPELLRTLSMKSSWGPTWARVVWGVAGLLVSASVFLVWKNHRAA